MKYDRLYNFISPVTGKLPIDRGYTLLGDKDGRSFVSPILIDVRQDIIDLRRKISNFEELNKLDYNRIWIGNYYNEPEEKLHIGVINLPPLAEAVFPNPISPIIGDFRIPNPTFNYFSPFDWVMSGPFLPQIYATKYDTFGNPIGTDISSSLAMTQVRAAQIMKRFDNANFIVGSSVVEFNWENPKMALIPEPLKQLYGLGTTYTFTKAQSLGNLQTGLLKNTVNNGMGTLSTAIAGEDYATTEQLEEIKQQCQLYAEEAAASAEEAAASALEASTSAVEATAAAAEASAAAAEATAAAVEASASAAEATGAAVVATVAALAAGISAGSASSSASDAQQSANSASSSASSASSSAQAASGSAGSAANSATAAQTYLNTLLNTGLTLQGDVTGSGLLSTPIITTFKPNPVFTGKGSITIPSGTIEQRPNILVVGMIRIVEN